MKLCGGEGYDSVQGFDLARGCTGPDYTIYNRLGNIRESNTYYRGGDGTQFTCYSIPR